MMTLNTLEFGNRVGVILKDQKMDIDVVSF